MCHLTSTWMPWQSLTHKINKCGIIINNNKKPPRFCPLSSQPSCRCQPASNPSWLGQSCFLSTKHGTSLHIFPHTPTHPQHTFPAAHTRTHTHHNTHLFRWSALDQLSHSGTSWNTGQEKPLEPLLPFHPYWASDLEGRAKRSEREEGSGWEQQQVCRG